jgi:hypothetical protein
LARTILTPQTKGAPDYDENILTSDTKGFPIDIEDSEDPDSDGYLASSKDYFTTNILHKPSSKRQPTPNLWRGDLSFPYDSHLKYWMITLKNPNKPLADYMESFIANAPIWEYDYPDKKFEVLFAIGVAEHDDNANKTMHYHILVAFDDKFKPKYSNLLSYQTLQWLPDYDEKLIQIQAVTFDRVLPYMTKFIPGRLKGSFNTNTCAFEWFCLYDNQNSDTVKYVRFRPIYVCPTHLMPMSDVMKFVENMGNNCRISEILVGLGRSIPRLYKNIKMDKRSLYKKRLKLACSIVKSFGINYEQKCIILKNLKIYLMILSCYS